MRSRRCCDASSAARATSFRRQRRTAARARDRETERRAGCSAPAEVLLLHREIARFRGRRVPTRPGPTTAPPTPPLLNACDLEVERDGFMPRPTRRCADASRTTIAAARTRKRSPPSSRCLAAEGKTPPQAAAGTTLPAEGGASCCRGSPPRSTSRFEGKERKAIERVPGDPAVLHRPRLPGLRGEADRRQDTWSLRASLGLRVYFRQSPTATSSCSNSGDRGGRHTTLRA